MDIKEHPIYEKIYNVQGAVEALGASEELTEVSALIDEVIAEAKTLVEKNKSLMSKVGSFTNVTTEDTESELEAYKKEVNEKFDKITDAILAVKAEVKEKQDKDYSNVALG